MEVLISFLSTLGFVTYNAVSFACWEALKQMGHIIRNPYINQSCPHEIGIKPQFLIKLYRIGHLFLDGKTAGAKPNQNCPQNMNERNHNCLKINSPVTSGPLFLEW